MSAHTYGGRTAALLLLVLATLNGLFSDVYAQAPVITNPGDLHYLDVNTGFKADDSNPLWTVMAPMPTTRAGFAIAATGQKVYVIGGAVLNNCTTVSTVESYDPSKDLWTTGLAPLPAPPRWRPSGVALGDIIYVIGGASTENGCAGEALATVQAYDPATDSWSEKPPMPTPRLQVGLVVDTANNLLYAIGGVTASPDFTALDTVEVFDPTGNGGAGSWTTKQHLNTARGLPALGAINGKIYAVGGQAGQHRTIDSIEEYDPISDTWTTKSSTVPSPPRLDPGNAVLGDKIYVMGGEKAQSNGRPLSIVDVYDPVVDAWDRAPSMPTARRVLGAASVNDTLYAIGGEAPIGKVGERFTYQITATNKPTAYDASPLPDGLSIDHTRGIISGVPTDTVQNFIVKFSASNESGTASKDVSFYIAPAASSEPGVPRIVSGTCATARASSSQPFKFQVLTNYASPAAQLAATGLPYLAGVGPELRIDPGTGFISGMVPPAFDGSAQSFGIELGLADGSATDQSFLELTFVSDPLVPVITSSSSAALVLNQFFSYTITADAPASFLNYIGLDGVLNGSLPSGLSFDNATGTISGIYGLTATANYDANAYPGPITNGGFPGDGLDGVDTIKKEPPPHIQLLTGNNTGGAGTAPLNFIIGLHDLEIETLTNQTSQGTDYSIFTNDARLSAGAAGSLDAVNVADYVSYTVPVDSVGMYDVRVGIKTDADKGVFQLAIDGTNQGSPQDEYSSSVGYEIRDLGPVTFSSAGSKTFKFALTGQNPNSSGSELVFDYIDLVPYFEAEALSVQANSAPYRTIHDTDLSGGSGTLFEASQVGDYLSYTVPIAVAGAYNVTVGTKTGRDAGIFELLIDGVREGYDQNEHASALTGGTVDLGTVVFQTPGNKTFQFLITGRDPKSRGYGLVLDYIELALSSHFEAEMLRESATAPILPVSDENMSGQSGVLLNAKAAGRLVTYIVPVPVAGTYQVKVGVRTGSKSGIFQLAVDGVNQGSTQDEFSARDDYKVLDLGRVTFVEAGRSTFEFLVTGQNANSRGYQLVFDYIDLVR